MRNIIGELNDRFRQGDMSLGIYWMTPEVRALTFEQQDELLQLVRDSNWFSDNCNEPDYERNFGRVTLDRKVYCWQIDYKDPSLTQASEDPANPNVTKRTMTLMREDEY